MDTVGKLLLQDELREAEARVEAIKRRIATAPCAEAGHDWKHVGGTNAGCPRGDDCVCSVPVHECTRCGDCDYGVNDEASDVINACELTYMDESPQPTHPKQAPSGQNTSE